MVTGLNAERSVSYHVGLPPDKLGQANTLTADVALLFARTQGVYALLASQARFGAWTICPHAPGSVIQGTKTGYGALPALRYQCHFNGIADDVVLRRP